MTLQQLKYVITVAEVGTITEAAENSLFRSQAGQKGRICAFGQTVFKPAMRLCFHGRRQSPHGRRRVEEAHPYPQHCP